ncbi:hypothetical protein SAMN06265348_12412 [Pedobacter westerhofensis]|uniref:Uncharacterized protein n=1 Tax=Pedobacter westerhofensis TaxID=425512 RepID=A0A521FTU3_9SPHI|nr:hypothetical protein SAMN06265348_12412 [Pedobacter westerhofensis]
MERRRKESDHCVLEADRNNYGAVLNVCDGYLIIKQAIIQDGKPVQLSIRKERAKKRIVMPVSHVGLAPLLNLNRLKVSLPNASPAV